MSLFTFGAVLGSESLSSPTSFVITFPSIVSSSDIHATFVNTLLLSVDVTLHSSSNVVESKLLPPSYAVNLSSLLDSLVIVTLLLDES